MSTPLFYVLDKSLPRVWRAIEERRNGYVLERTGTWPGGAPKSFITHRQLEAGIEAGTHDVTHKTQINLEEIQF